MILGCDSIVALYDVVIGIWSVLSHVGRSYMDSYVAVRDRVRCVLRPDIGSNLDA